VEFEGFHQAYYSTILLKLMTKLNYQTFITQGGDWGSLIAR